MSDNNGLNKYIITFGSNHLEDFAVNSTSVILVIEALSEGEAREPLFNPPFNGRFSFSYRYNTNAEKFKRLYNMVEYTLDELMELKMEN